MSVFSALRAAICEALDALAAEGAIPVGLSYDAVTTEPPRDPAHGDVASNAAMALAKSAGRKPRDIAEALAAKLAGDPRVVAVDVAGPGFLNFRLSEDVWRAEIAATLAAGTGYGRSALGGGRHVNVEFVSANPTGPLHIGHTRGAVFGDALASLLDFAGYKVTREYYINDGGAQVDVLARSAYLRYREANGEAYQVVAGLYPGDYLVQVGEALKAEFGDSLMQAPEDEWLPKVRDFSIAAIMDMIRGDLASIGVRMDVFSSEKALYGSGRIETALGELEAKGLIYRGVLEPPKGKTPEDWEPREQLLFRSTAYGDDVDRPIQKSDGGWTYFAPDIAYHYDKLQRADELIDVLGADHGGYVKRMKAACKALSDGEDRLDIKLCQLVKLMKNGEEFKMSKRAGNFVLLSDAVELVGADVTRFIMLTRKNDAALDFDVDKALEQSKENPVWYVQYANARICSTLRAAEAAGIPADDAALASADLSRLTHPAQIKLMRQIGEWPRIVELAAKAHEPHRVSFYLTELAGDLHALWNLGRDSHDLRFVQEADHAASQATLALARATSLTIGAGLGILGVTPLEELR